MRVGLTTVYRHLQRLSEAGEVDARRNRNGETAYRRCGEVGHHHHLVCQRCGRVVDIDGPAVETWLRRIARDAGFTDIEHTLELAGTCSSCATSTHAAEQDSVGDTGLEPVTSRV